MKRITKKKLILSILLYAALLGVVLSVSFSWFINNREASIITDDDMVITVGGKLEVRMADDEASEWGSLISMNIDKIYPDITGDGNDFYFPLTLGKDDIPVYNDPESFIYINEAKKPEIYMLTLKLNFRTSVPMDVYLSNLSNILGEDMETADDLTKSVSSDVIVGAVRVAFYENGTQTLEDGSVVATETLKSIWIPNDKYEIISERNKYTFTEDGTRETYKYLAPNNGAFNEDTTAMEEREWSIDQYASGYLLVGHDRLAQNGGTDGDKAVLPMTNGSPSLLRFDCANGSEEKTLTVRIWIEGTDREAITTLNGGRIKYALNFVGISKEACTDEELAVLDGIHADATNILLKEDGSSVQSGLLRYSLNGIDWDDYDPLETDLSTADEVYIHLTESRDKLPSRVRKITLN